MCELRMTDAVDAVDEVGVDEVEPAVVLGVGIRAITGGRRR